MPTLQVQEAYSFYRTYILEYSRNKAEIYEQYKLTDDRDVDRIFVARSKTYTNVEVWLVERTKMIPTFDRWLPELLQNYEAADRQRFRRSAG